ncbi:hypothetical protein C8Q74DRAFT_1311590 [Fomes fomentarius]|nr:hypothetical protein C8Q74DRAFT_1311590 [Fomes fomentarius]
MGLTGVMECLRRAYPEERPASVEAMLDTILDSAIDIVGLVARDVYDAMFGLTRAELRLADAIAGSPQDLEHAVKTFVSLQSFTNDGSSRIVCVYPEAFLDDGEVSRWVIAFRSRRVQEKVVERLMDRHREQTRKLCSTFKSIPQAASMAGNLFEAIAHGALMQKDDGNPWPLFLMKQSPNHQRTFTATAADRMLARVTLPKVERVKKSLNVLPDSLEDQHYYIPEALNFPFIHSFTVDIDNASHSATLWLFRMAMSWHDSSDEGYVEIGKLIATLRDQFKDNERPRKKAKLPHPLPRVLTIRYVLVSPADDSASIRTHSWKMPRGWDQRIAHANNNDQGEVYLLEIPL